MLARRRSCSVALASALLSASLLGCGPDDAPLFPADEVPGGASWADADVSCSEERPCADGEACVEGVCQMQRCSQEYDSVAPLGQAAIFGGDLELLVVSDARFVDGYDPDGSDYLGSWEQPADRKVTDATGGNLLGKRPGAVATAYEFSDEIRIEGGEEPFLISVGIWPRALASGDVDADGVDELVALSDDGSFAVCSLVKDECRVRQFEGTRGIDVAVGDVDGDGYGEPTLLLEIGGKPHVVVWNADAEKTGQEESQAWLFDKNLRSIAAGKLRGGPAEIVLLEDDAGTVGTDYLHVFRADTGETVTTRKTDEDCLDIAVGDTNYDRKEEITLLKDRGEVEIFRLGEAGLASVGTRKLSSSADVSRIDTFDIDDDSPGGRLLEGPTLVPGGVVPLAVLVFPPYPSDKSDGHGSVFLGKRESTSVSASETVSLGVGVTVGVGTKIGGVVDVELSTSLSVSISETKTLSQSMDVSQSFSVTADPARYGHDYAGVVVSCGCFHAYRYETHDPKGRIGGSGQDIYVLSPVGGDMALWSSKRYNAMAERLGGLPLVRIPGRIGDVDSYPTQPLALSGDPISKDDLLFPVQPVVQASDVGTAGWSQTVSNSDTNASAESTTLGVSASVGAFGVKGGANVSWTHGTGYSITVGQDATFGGSIPAVPDDPSTPEDEYAVNRFSFVPFVYRERYADQEGNEAGYYVINYAVGK